MALERLSPFRMGWLLAYFDLPVGLQEERKQASTFRKRLLDQGFLMIQYSVYARPCVTLDSMEKYSRRVRSFAPVNGNVRLMFLTDLQWERTVVILNHDGWQGNREIDPQMPDQMEFW